jgi:hypothetical protein
VLTFHATCVEPAVSIDEKTIVRRFFEVLWNAKRLGQVDECVARDYVDGNALPMPSAPMAQFGGDSSQTLATLAQVNGMAFHASAHPDPVPRLGHGSVTTPTLVPVYLDTCPT